MLLLLFQMSSCSLAFGSLRMDMMCGISLIQFYLVFLWFAMTVMVVDERVTNVFDGCDFGKCRRKDKCVEWDREYVGGISASLLVWMWVERSIEIANVVRRPHVTRLTMYNAERKNFKGANKQIGKNCETL